MGYFFRRKLNELEVWGLMTSAAYRKIADQLRSDLRKGKWKPGERMPSQSELAERFGVSVPTARSAVMELVAESLVFTATNRGTIVRNRQVLDHVVTDSVRRDRPRSSSSDVFVETARQAGRVPGKEFDMRMEPASADVAGWLGVTAGEWVVARQVVQVIDGEPWAYEVSYYPRVLAEAAGLDQPTDIPEGTTRRMADRGYGETAWRDTDYARPATPDEAAQLQIPVGAWIEDYLRIGANRDQVTRVTRIRRMADRNRTIHELGDDAGLAMIRAALADAGREPQEGAA